MGGTRVVAVLFGGFLLTAGLYPSSAEEPSSAVIDTPRCRDGDALFRRAQVREAEEAYRAALEVDPQNARAWWGLGRIASLESRPTDARDFFAKAFRLDPRDPEIILAFAGFARDPAARSVLFRNVVAVSQATQPDLAASARAQLGIEARVQGEKLNRLAGPYTRYRVQLAGYHPLGAKPDGLVLPVRIDGGKPLRLVFDTGARGIVIHARAARDLRLETVAQSQLDGLGGSGATTAELTLARSVRFGDLELRDCPIEIAARTIAPEADGVIGAGIFRDFQIHVDPGARILDLTPYPAEAEAGISVLTIRDLLLVRAKVDRGRDGLFLVDSGAAYTSVSPDLGSHGLRPAAPVSLRGARGDVPRVFRMAPLELEMGGRTFVDSSAVAVDLAGISEAEGIEISGILGYSLLGKTPFTLNYRDGVIRLER